MTLNLRSPSDPARRGLQPSAWRRDLDIREKEITQNIADEAFVWRGRRSAHQPRSEISGNRDPAYRGLRAIAATPAGRGRYPGDMIEPFLRKIGLSPDAERMGHRFSTTLAFTMISLPTHSGDRETTLRPPTRNDNERYLLCRVDLAVFSMPFPDASLRKTPRIVDNLSPAYNF
jgi:hypothetical protein